MNENRVANGVMVYDIDDKVFRKITESIETDDQFGYGKYLYRFDETGFGLYRNEFVTEKELKDWFGQGEYDVNLMIAFNAITLDKIAEMWLLENKQ